MHIDNVVLQLLSRRDYFTLELTQKLTQKGFSLEEVALCLNKWKAKGYLNDEDLALRFIEKQRSLGHGREIVRQKLYFRSKDPALLHLLDKASFDEKKEITKLFMKRFSSANLQDAKERRRVFAYFARKGFSFESINEAIFDSCIDKDLQ